MTMVALLGQQPPQYLALRALFERLTRCGTPVTSRLHERNRFETPNFG